MGGGVQKDLWKGGAELIRQLVHRDSRVGAERHQALDYVLEFPHVSGPGIVGENLKHICGEILVCMVLLVEMVEEKGGQGADVVLALP